jgi:hypothetical protein
MKYLPILSAGIADPSRDPSWADRVPASMKRRDPRIWHLAHVAARRAIDTAASPPRSIVCATALGALDETQKYLDGVFGDGFGSPRHFIASVHNSMAGKLAVEFSIDGPNITVCEGQNSFASAVTAASVLSAEDFPALICAVDENTALMHRLLPHLSAQCREFLREGWTEAAVAFVVGQPHDTQNRPCIAAAGPRIAAGADAQSSCAAITADAGFGASSLLSLAETSDSFVRPALEAHRLYFCGAGGEHCIGSYSPSARAAAAVCLCV